MVNIWWRASQWHVYSSTWTSWWLFCSSRDYHRCVLDKCEMAHISYRFSIWKHVHVWYQCQLDDSIFVLQDFSQWNSDKSHPIAGRKETHSPKRCLSGTFSYSSTTVFFQALKKSHPNFWPFTLSSLINIFVTYLRYNCFWLHVL